MPRPERVVDPTAGPVQALAASLRKLREAAGNPGYREMVRRVGFSTTALSEAAGGRRLPGLAVLLGYVRACGGDVAQWQDRWQAVVAELADDGEDPPYLGLASFQVADAARFFGRERAVDDLLARLAEGRFLAVLGASGSGKSSLLRAGLAAAAQSSGIDGQTRRLVIFTPGSTPEAEWQARLPDVHSGGALVIVDQLEELFTLCQDPRARERFVAQLLSEAGTPERDTMVVLGIRADFCAACAQFPRLASAMAGRTVLISSLDNDDLSLAITKPARLAGRMVERALVTQVLADAGGRPGALPLVSHALLETWRHQQGTTLTLAAYETAGGVRGAVARTAERIYHHLDVRQRAVARQILVRLIALGQGTEDTRRIVRRAELELDHADEVIDELVRGRLVTVSGDTVEIAHEALIGAWPRLRDWMMSDRRRLQTQRQLIEAAASWQALNRDHDALYRGSRLAVVREWAADDDLRGELTATEREFLDASIRAERRRSRQVKTLAGTLAVLLALALAGGVTAAWQWHGAVEEREQAISRQLATQAMAISGTDVPEAIRLSVQGYRSAPTVEARSALLSLASQQAYTGRLSHSGMVKDVVFSPDGRSLATAGQDGRISIWDVATRSRQATLTGHNAAVRSLAYAPHGRWLVSGSLNGTVIVWDLQRQTEARRLRTKGGLIDSVAVSPDGATVAALGQERRIMLWRVADGAYLGELAGHGGEFAEVAFSPDGKLLVSAGDDGTAVLWNLASRTRLRTLAASDQPVHTATFSPDGATVAVAGEDPTITIWSATTGERLKALRDHSAQVRTVVFARDGVLASASYDGSAALWDVRRGKRMATLSGHTSALYAVAVSPDGRTVASGSRDRQVLLWDRDRMPMAAHVDEVLAVSVTADGRTVSSASKDGTVVLWDATSRQARAVLRRGEPPRGASNPAFYLGATDAAFDVDGRRVLSVNRDRTAHIWDAASGRLVRTMTGHTDPILTAAFHPDGTIAATGGLDRTVRIWDIQRGVQLAALPASGQIQEVAFTMDGRVFMSATLDGAVTIWDFHTRRSLALLREKPGLVSAALNRDGTIIAVGRADGTVAVWNIARHTEIGLLHAHSGPVNSLDFSPDGAMLATAGLDGTVRLWSFPRRLPWATLAGAQRGINDVTWSADGQHLYTGGGDQTVSHWYVNPAEAERAAGGQLERGFPDHHRLTRLGP